MSILRSILSGSLWTVAARWAIRSVGLVSTVILARLLSPADFGVVAMAMVVINFIEVFGDTGLGLYIVRHPDPPRSLFDTAWTLRIMLGIGLAIIMIAVSPAAALFFHQPNLAAAIRVLAIRPVLSGLENPGMILFRKNMVFSKDFRFLVTNKIVSFVVTVTLALLLRNWWALVIGIVTGGVASAVQSYMLHPFRPRPSLSEVRVVAGYSFWVLAQNLLACLNSRIDELVVGRVMSIQSLGYYTVASDVASSPVGEVVAPVGRVLFPGIARLVNEGGSLTVAFRKIVSGLAILTVSIATGIVLVASDLTRVLLGPAWMPVVPLLRILAVSAALLALAQPAYTWLNATNQPRSSALLSLARQIMLVIALVPAAIFYGLLGVAIARAVVAAVTFVVTIQVTARLSATRSIAIWGGMVRPSLAAIIMCGVVMLCQEMSPDQPVFRLFFAATVGAVTYGTALLLLWRMAGRPDGVESDLLQIALRHVPRFAEFVDRRTT